MEKMLRANSELSARIRIIRNNLMQKDLEEKRSKMKHQSMKNIKK